MLKITVAWKALSPKLPDEVEVKAARENHRNLLLISKRFRFERSDLLRPPLVQRTGGCRLERSAECPISLGGAVTLQVSLVIPGFHQHEMVAMALFLQEFAQPAAPLAAFGQRLLHPKRTARIGLVG